MDDILVPEVIPSDDYDSSDSFVEEQTPVYFPEDSAHPGDENEDYTSSVDETETEPPDTRELIYIDIDGKADPADTAAMLEDVRDRLEQTIQFQQATMEYTGITCGLMLALVVAVLCAAVYKFFRFFF